MGMDERFEKSTGGVAKAPPLPRPMGSWTSPVRLAHTHASTRNISE